MRKVLLSASAVALAFGMTAGAQAAGPIGSDINFVNIAVNTDLLSGDPDGPQVDGSINVSAIGGDIGHQGWHPGRSLGKNTTFAAGAVNQTDLSIGRDMRAGALEVNYRESGAVDGFHVDDITYVGLEAGAAGWSGGSGGVIGVEGEYFNVEEATFVSADYRTRLEVEGRFFESVVPQTNVVNLAFNNQSINGSANYASVFRSGEIGNIGAISTSAIGALNVTTAAIGVPGSLSDLGD